MGDPLTQHNKRSENPLALDLRTRFNNERGSFDLALWVQEHANLGAGAQLLDVGCGTGRLLLRYGEVAIRQGRCVAIDISPDSLRELRQAAELSGVGSLESLCLDMDRLASEDAHPELRGFTHIVSAYALYYSADAAQLLEGLAWRLRPDGTLLVVAPAPGNNAEWFGLLQDAGVRIPDEIRDVAFFLERTVLPFAQRRFKSVRVERATNTVRYESADEIEAYWRSNIYYDEDSTRAVRACADAVCNAQGVFTNHKRIGLVAMRELVEP